MKFNGESETDIEVQGEIFLVFFLNLFIYF